MILLHLEIDETGQGIFTPDTPSPLLLEAVQSVVWFKDETALLGGGTDWESRHLGGVRIRIRHYNLVTYWTNRPAFL